MATRIGSLILILTVHYFSALKGRILRRTGRRLRRDHGASSKGETMAEVRTAVRSNEYLRNADVARVLHVSTKNVSRWANDQQLPYMQRLGGHRRVPARAMRQADCGSHGPR